MKHYAKLRNAVRSSISLHARRNSVNSAETGPCGNIGSWYAICSVLAFTASIVCCVRILPHPGSPGVVVTAVITATPAVSDATRSSIEIFCINCTWTFNWVKRSTREKGVPTPTRAPKIWARRFWETLIPNCVSAICAQAGRQYPIAVCWMCVGCLSGDIVAGCYPFDLF